ncbi:MAG TPA: SpoIID/LytB domain-containing protein [Actinomycetota bacterium]
MTRDPKLAALRAALVAVVAAGLLAAPAGAAKGFRFNGSGWGHGIGLGQYGAFGLAKEGWGPAKIVRHFYTNTSVQRRDPPKGRFRVGLLQGRQSVSVAVQRGRAVLRVGKAVVERIRAGATRRILIVNGRYRVKRPNGSVVKKRLWGSAKKPLEVRLKNGGVVRVPEWGHSAGRGFLRLKIVGKRSAHLVAVVPAEKYLYGLGEVPSSWPMAALKAQAIAARSYAYVVVGFGRTGCACDIYASTRDQAYVGWDKESGTAGGRWVKAVGGTSRKVAVHGGAVIQGLYSSSSGGYTENVENVWGGGAVGYLKGVCDPGDWTTANPNRLWSTSFTPRGLASRLGRPNGIVRVTAVNVNKRGVSGRVVTATVKGKRGNGSTASWSTSGWNLRGRLGLRDTRFWVNQDRQVTGKIREAYDELDCRPGLPKSNQKKISGARWQRFENGRIYHHAGRKRETWLRGSVLDAYLSLGGHGGFLGRPWSYGAQAGGVRARFDGGAIYHHDAVGAHEVHGPVLATYLSHGGPASVLGFPTSDVVSEADGTLVSTFQGGTISCPPDAGCTVTPA